MIKKTFMFLILILGLPAFAACTLAGPVESADAAGGRSPQDKVSIEKCPTAEPGHHQLIYAAKGICFNYPDTYDVFEGEDGSFTLYVDSLLNTEAPIASFNFEPANGRPLEAVLGAYLPHVDFTLARPLTINLGGETAVVLDNMPGQDINRRVIVIYDGLVMDMMVARIGEEYGAVGEQAEVLFETIVDSFQFIGIEPEAPLLAGPECPEAVAGTFLYTNFEDGYCLLLPDGYTVDESLISKEGSSQTAVFVDSPLNTANPKLFILVEAANGRTLEAVTTDKAAEIKEILGSDAQWSFGHMLGGVAANQFDQVPGQDLSRQVLLVKDGRFFSLVFIPDEAAMGQAYAEMELLYDTVMESFDFLRQAD